MPKNPAVDDLTETNDDDLGQGGGSSDPVIPAGTVPTKNEDAKPPVSNTLGVDPNAVVSLSDDANKIDPTKTTTTTPQINDGASTGASALNATGGTNPNATATNPNAGGTNPNATGTNPDQKKKVAPKASRFNLDLNDDVTIPKPPTGSATGDKKGDKKAIDFKSDDIFEPDKSAANPSAPVSLHGPSTSTCSTTTTTTTTRRIASTMTRKRQLEFQFVFKENQKNQTAEEIDEADVRSKVTKAKDDDDDEIPTRGEYATSIIKSIIDVGASAVGEKDLSYQYPQADEGKQKEAEERKKYIDNNLDISKSALSAGSSFFGLLNHSFSAYKQKKKADRTKLKNRRSAEYKRGMAGLMEVGADSMSTLDNVHDAILTGLGYGDKSSKSAGNMVFGVASSGFNIAGNILKFMANKDEQKAHTTIAEEAAKFANPQKDDADLRAARDTIGLLSRGGPDRKLKSEVKPSLEEARQARRNIKARKYAMGQAASLHKAKSDNFKTDALGTVLDVLDNVAGAGKSIGKIPFNDKAVGISLSASGGILSSIVKAAKTWKSTYEKTDKAKAGEKAFETAKKDVVTKYLDDGVKKIKDKATAWQADDVEKANLANCNAKDDENADNTLTDKEAKRLVLMKLGFYVKKNSDVDSVSSDEIFKKITEKRANQIMKADKSTKDAMLISLGFPKNELSKVSYNDIYKVLSGETL